MSEGFDHDVFTSGEMLFNSSMADMEAEKQSKDLQLRSLMRIARIPLVETGWDYAADIYTRIKGSNSLFTWGFDTAESKVFAVWEHTKPFVTVFHGPLNIADSIICKGLDLVEQQIPVVTLPPELIFVNTKEYVNSNIVRPVLKRADSAKQFGREQVNHVLESRYTNFAAQRIDSALDMADKYIDQYLPDSADQTEENEDAHNHIGGSSRAAQTIHKVDRFSRKLQRRLTHRTLAEAKALKRQSEDTLQTLLYLGELLAKDPKAVYELGVALWQHLSEDEPENQVPPTTLEQLTIMLTRETARRIVHFVNYTRSTFKTLPQNVKISLHRAAHYCAQLTETLAKAAHLEDARNVALRETTEYLAKINGLYTEVNKYANELLESMAKSIAGKDLVKKLLSPKDTNKRDDQRNKTQGPQKADLNEANTED